MGSNDKNYLQNIYLVDMDEGVLCSEEFLHAGPVQLAYKGSLVLPYYAPSFTSFVANLDGDIVHPKWLGLNLRLWLPQCHFRKYIYLFVQTLFLSDFPTRRLPCDYDAKIPKQDVGYSEWWDSNGR